MRTRFSNSQIFIIQVKLSALLLNPSIVNDPLENLPIPSYLNMDDKYHGSIARCTPMVTKMPIVVPEINANFELKPGLISPRSEQAVLWTDKRRSSLPQSLFQQ
ncbi:hypothetical protein Tco_0010563 [Tanacetum coccineum]